MPQPVAAPPDLRRHLIVETPEHVALEYEIAGIGSRAAAALVDQAIVIALIVAMVLVFRFTGLAQTLLGPLTGAFLLGGAFAIWYGYFIFFEAFRHGQTPGKRWLGLRVVSDSGHAISRSGAVVRNLLRIADFLPPPYLGGGLLVALHPRGRRLGDIVGGTIVVRDQPTEQAPAKLQPRDEAAPVAEAPELDDREFALLDAFVSRADELAPSARGRLAAELAQRLSVPLADVDPDRPLPERLATLLEAEQARRTSGLAARGGGPAWQLIARQGSRWDEFDALASRVQKRGLDDLAPAELPDFAARYREVAADLARLRTYGADSRVIERVDRLVAAGHNALYRNEGHALSRAWEVISRECPAAVLGAWREVVLACLMFAVPAAVGYRMLRDRPELAEQVLPAVMLDRAEAGREARGTGKRYVEVAARVRPAIASAIITNNVRVALYCFAGGIFLGIGSLVLLALNGLQLGASFGHYVNVGLGAYLGEFIIGHGVLELSAIWIAGGAGFLLGRTLIAPGDLARGDALVLAGRRAVRMLGACVVCLLVAGLIEGLVSTSAVSWTGRLIATGASLVFLGGYLINGVRRGASGMEGRGS
ncbi:MAG TPA: stage II sporulation protein M [Gemmatimonadales bacterium]|nr:stage II sporulation protein M [Gemmatimonadales bacterium]